MNLLKVVIELFFKKFNDNKNGIFKNLKFEKKKEDHPFFKIESEFEKDNKFFKLFKKKELKKLIDLKKEEENDFLLKNKILGIVCGKSKKGYYDILMEEKKNKSLKKKIKKYFTKKPKNNLLNKILNQNIFE